MIAKMSTEIPSIPQLLRAIADAIEAKEKHQPITQHYYTIGQAATYLGVSSRTVQRRIDDGDLKLRKGGISIEDLERYANAEIKRASKRDEPILTPLRRKGA